MTLCVELIDPSFIEDVDPYITCLSQYKRGNVHEPFDLVNGGSGFHQLVTLFAIIYWNKGTHLLLDEPDAHLHAWAQAGILDFLQDMTRKGEAQVIIATHSISILDRCKPEDVYSLMTPSPRWLVLEREKFSIRSGLDSVETSLLTYLEQIPFVLYIEGSSDIELLRLFAGALGKDEKLFERLPYHILRGRDPKQAREHFLGVKSFRNNIKALCLLDPDTDRENLSESIERHGESELEFYIWKRRHIESYLLVPEAIARTLYPNQPLFHEGIIKSFPVIQLNQHR